MVRIQPLRLDNYIRCVLEAFKVDLLNLLLRHYLSSRPP